MRINFNTASRHGKARPAGVLALVVLGLVGVLAVARMMASEDRIPWRRDFTAATAEAKAANKPVFLYFTASWCGPCQQMKQTTWADAKVEAALEKFVPVKVDIDEQPDVARTFGVEAVPTYGVVGDDGKFARKQEGFLTADELLGWLNGK